MIYFKNNISRLYFNYDLDKIECTYTGKPITNEIIIVSQCISIVCEDLNLSTDAYCLGDGKNDPFCKTPSGYCGLVCTFYVKFTLSFLRSLADKGIDHVFVTLLNSKNTEK